MIDVRLPLEYESGHLPGALSIPVDELDQRLAGLPRDRRIIAYCRGDFDSGSRDFYNIVD